MSDSAVQTTIVDDTHTAPTFAELGVDDRIVSALAADGKTHTFAIQELTLPLAMGGDDLTVTAVAQGRDAAEDIHRSLMR